RGLESLTADRPRGPGDQPQLAGVLGPILPVAAQRRQKGSRIGSVVPLDPLGDGTRLCLAELERGPRRDGPQVGFQALPTLREINQDRIAKFELTTVDNRPSSLVFLEDDRTGEPQHLLAAKHGQAPRLHREVLKRGTGYDCQTAVVTSSPPIDRSLLNGNATAVGSLG